MKAAIQYLHSLTSPLISLFLSNNGTIDFRSSINRYRFCSLTLPSHGSMAVISPPHSTVNSNAQQESRMNDWRGPDDPGCPYNWPKWKRIYMTSIPAFLCINVLAYSINSRSVLDSD